MRLISLFLATLFALFANAFPFDWKEALEKRQITDVNQNQNVNQNNINVVTSATNNTVCTHGERRCTNSGEGGYNSTDLCNWNQWIRYQCPQGLMCVEVCIFCFIF